MVEVATGGDSGEQLPMVLKVPHLGSNPLKVCWMPYSMLGFGDILVPGLLLSYCHSFDLLVKTPYRLYWILTNIGFLSQYFLAWENVVHFSEERLTSVFPSVRKRGHAIPQQIHFCLFI
jgi:hypothetical protein